MTTEHQITLEEEAYWQLLDEIWEKLSEPARAVIEEAQSAAHAAYMVRGYCFQWHFEYDEAMELIKGFNNMESKSQGMREEAARQKNGL